MAYYSNGNQRNDDRGPPDRERFTYWYGPSYGVSGSEEPPSDPFNPVWKTDARVTVAKRELFRRMGGKPQGASQQQQQEWQRYAVGLVLAMHRDPCAAFSSKPPNEPWDWRAWAAFCNWFAWLAPEYRAELLADVVAGRCDRWMPVVLNMRPYAPTDTQTDPTYSAQYDWQIYQTGDDPAFTAQNTSGPGTPCQECMYCALAQPRPAFCLGTDYTAPSWPVVTQLGALAIPGLPKPCEPFPSCLLESLPTGPCSPWPDCAFELAAKLAQFTPGAVVTRTADGATYVPAQAPIPSQPAPADQGKPQVTGWDIAKAFGMLAGVTVVAVAGVYGVARYGQHKLEQEYGVKMREAGEGAKGWTPGTDGNGRRNWTSPDGSTQIRDGGAKTQQRYQVMHLRSGKWLEDIGWPSLTAAVEYAEGRRSLRQHPMHARETIGAADETKGRFRVPKTEIDWIVGNYNVSVPDEQVRSEMRARCAKAGMSEARTRACADYAVKRHQRNRDLYVRVMSGKL